MNLRSILMLALMMAGTIAVRAQQGNEVLFSVGGEPVTVEEFKYIYEKNNASDKNLYAPKNLNEYLELYTNFKLKVREAHDLGLDSTDKFLREFSTYRNQLAQPYLTDREVTQKLIDEAYERMKYELRVSHILINLMADASPKDTLAAYNKALEVRNMAVKGASFDSLARKFSKDPSVANNGGDLGYFTAFHMIYPFESASYALTQKGQISMPVRSRFGYHIIKLVDRRPYRGDIQVRHILVNTNANDPVDKQTMAKSKADSLYSQLQKGVTFAELARQYSEHTQTKQAGGELPPFNTFSQYPDEFKDAAFSLQKDGDYTKPFRSNFGWHLLQRVSLKTMQSRKEMEETLKQKISRDSRSEKSMEAAIARFKKEYNYVETKKAVKKFSKYYIIDSTLVKGTWAAKPRKAKKYVMFTLDGKPYTSEDFAKYLVKTQVQGRFSDPKFAVGEYFIDFVNASVYEYQDKNLEKRYPEFKNVAKEYRKGILLFEITDQKVWGKAMSDSTGQLAFFQNNKSKYQWKERADAIIVGLRDKAAVADIRKQLAAGKSIDVIADAYIKKDPLSLNFKKGLYERGEMPLLDQLKWEKGTYDAGMSDGRFYVIKINEVKKPETKQLSEIRGMVTADYQDYLEKEWVRSLRQKYPVKVNADVLNKMMQKN